jgi:hypothetical protein
MAAIFYIRIENREFSYLEFAQIVKYCPELSKIVKNCIGPLISDVIFV